MTQLRGLVFVRLLPVLLIVASSMIYVAWIEGTDAYVWRNLLPMLLVVLLAWVTLVRGGGRWNGSGWRWPLGTVGFATPSIGLSLYLHYGYSIDMGGMFSQSVYPQELFRYLPLYTVVAGAIGFAIGWIAGRNV